MIPQTLEELLHRKSFLFSDSVDIQVLVDSAIADLRSKGKLFVVTKILSNTPRWIGRTVVVPGADSKIKEVVVQSDSKMEELKMDFVYCYPDEVTRF